MSQALIYKQGILDLRKKTLETGGMEWKPHVLKGQEEGQGGKNIVNNNFRMLVDCKIL